VSFSSRKKPMAHKIYNKPVLDKLGVKPESVVTVLSIDDEKFWNELVERTRGAVRGKLRVNTDLVFFGADRNLELKKLKNLEHYIKPNGAIWVVSRKGKEATLKDVDVIAAAKATGLVDNKVVSFSETHTALRLVIPIQGR